MVTFDLIIIVSVARDGIRSAASSSMASMPRQLAAATARHGKQSYLASFRFLFLCVLVVQERDHFTHGGGGGDDDDQIVPTEPFNKLCKMVEYIRVFITT